MKFCSRTSHSGMRSFPFSFLFFVLTYFVGEFCPKSKKAHQEGSLGSSIKKKKDDIKLFLVKGRQNKENIKGMLAGRKYMISYFYKISAIQI